MVESVDTPDLKSVDHHGRGSSSLPTRTKINKTKRGAYVFLYLQGNSVLQLVQQCDNNSKNVFLEQYSFHF